MAICGWDLELLTTLAWHVVSFFAAAALSSAAACLALAGMPANTAPANTKESKIRQPFIASSSTLTRLLDFRDYDWVGLVGERIVLRQRRVKKNLPHVSAARSRPKNWNGGAIH